MAASSLDFQPSIISNADFLACMFLEQTEALSPSLPKAKLVSYADSISDRLTVSNTCLFSKATKPSYAAVVHQNSNSCKINDPSQSGIVIAGSAHIPISDAGSGYKAVKVPQRLYEERIKSCKYSVIGRLSLAKGDSPWKHSDLKVKLSQIWELDLEWKLISIGKGYFHIIMPSESALNRVWHKGNLGLQLGIMRFSVWKPGFDISNHKPTNAQVWVRLYNLPWVFWDKCILSTIARGIGIPLRFDKNTIEGEFGYYARILVDVDLAHPLKNQIRVDTDNDKFWVTLEYENIPALCNTYRSIGHTSVNCNKNKKELKHAKTNRTFAVNLARKDVKSRDVPTRNNNSEEVPTENVFKRLESDLQGNKKSRVGQGLKGNVDLIVVASAKKRNSGNGKEKEKWGDMLSSSDSEEENIHIDEFELAQGSQHDAIFRRTDQEYESSRAMIKDNIEQRNVAQEQSPIQTVHSPLQQPLKLFTRSKQRQQNLVEKKKNLNYGDTHEISNLCERVSSPLGSSALGSSLHGRSPQLSTGSIPASDNENFFPLVHGRKQSRARKK